MIKISAKAEYAARAVLDLSINYNNDKPLQLDDISKKMNIPREFLVQVMSMLTKSGIVSSRRGANGGYILKQSPKQTSLRSVIEAFDGNIGEFRCGDIDFSNCRGDPDCVFCKVWEDLVTIASQKLDRINFLDLSKSS